MKGLFKKLIIIIKHTLKVPSECQCSEFDKRSRSSSDDNIIIRLSESLLSYNKNLSPLLVTLSSSGIRISLNEVGRGNGISCFFLFVQ